MKPIIRIIIPLVASAMTASAATVVPVTGITGHDGGNWPDWAGHLTDFVNGSDPSILDPLVSDTPAPGMTVVDPADPATWTWSGGYANTWHANSFVPSGAENGKLGWVVVDFGEVVSGLENAYFWGTGQGGVGEFVDGFNIYTSSGVGIDALPAMPKSKGTTGDYHFSSGDWSFVASGNMNTTANNQAGPLDTTVALGGVSARYVGIEIMSMHGTPDATPRMAIAQVEFTAVPEPSAALLGAFGMLALLRRRR